MKLELNPLKARLHISAYSDSSITIAERRYAGSIIIADERIIENQLPACLSELQAHQLDAVIAMRPEIVLFGSGRRLRYPDDRVFQGLFEHRIGMEVMDTGAACRSFNFLLGEGRRVAALLFIGSPDDAGGNTLRA